MIPSDLNPFSYQRRSRQFEKRRGDVGMLVALPLTSGPVALFIALEAGTDVARQAAGGSLLGASAQVAFAAAYVLASRRLPWSASLLVAALAFSAVAFAVPAMPPLLTYALLLAAVGTFLATLGRRQAGGRSTLSAPTWDIPARVVVATALVLAISSLAPVFGRKSWIRARWPRPSRAFAAGCQARSASRVIQSSTRPS